MLTKLVGKFLWPTVDILHYLFLSVDSLIVRYVKCNLNGWFDNLL